MGGSDGNKIERFRQEFQIPWLGGPRKLFNLQRAAVLFYVSAMTIHVSENFGKFQLQMHGLLAAPCGPLRDDMPLRLRTIGRRDLTEWAQAGSRGIPLVAALEPSVEQFISPENFNRNHLEQSRPGYFPELVRHPSSPFRWPACTAWSSKEGILRGLKEIEDLQSIMVEVEISPEGRGYGDAIGKRKRQESKDSISDWMKVTMPFGLFLDAFIYEKIPWRNDTQQKVIGYLAQQNLFEKSPTLSEQCPILPHTLAGARGSKEQWRRNVWIGGAGSFTPIHCDPYENVFVQVAGSKRAFLFPPSAAPYLHLFPPHTSQANTSSIPTEEFLLSGSDRRQFSQLEKALSNPEAVHVTLEAGDALYIPQGWFHCLRSTSISASVNAWFR